jgi:hypothetical protein
MQNYPRQGQKNEKCDVQREREKIYKFSPFLGFRVGGSRKCKAIRLVCERTDNLVSPYRETNCPVLGEEPQLSPLNSFSLHRNFQMQLGPCRALSIHTYTHLMEIKASQNDRECAISRQNTKYKELVQYKILS